jgi:hypothetical protein
MELIWDADRDGLDGSDGHEFRSLADALPSGSASLLANLCLIATAIKSFDPSILQS